MSAAVSGPPGVVFDVPLVNPSPGGLYSAVAWQTDDGPPRWLAGAQFRGRNYGGEAAFGVWAPDWCAVEADLGPNDVKTGDRPGLLDPFEAVTVWAADECDLTGPSQDEVRTRAAQNLRLLEQPAVEREFASRLVADAGTPGAAVGLADAVGRLEELLAATNTVGVIHAAAGVLAAADNAHLIVRSGTGLRTPSGHLWVFGGGYRPVLGATLVATSPLFGWRTEMAVRVALTPLRNEFAAVAERSVVVGYEQFVGAVVVR